MAADKHGHELKEGDKVWIPCTVVSVDPDQENNLKVELEELIAPGRAKRELSVGSKQVTCGKKSDPTRGTPDKDDDDPHYKHKK